MWLVFDANTFRKEHKAHQSCPHAVRAAGGRCGAVHACIALLPVDQNSCLAIDHAFTVKNQAAPAHHPAALKRVGQSVWAAGHQDVHACLRSVAALRNCVPGECAGLLHI